MFDYPLVRFQCSASCQLAFACLRPLESKQRALFAHCIISAAMKTVSGGGDSILSLSNYLVQPFTALLQIS